MTPSEQAREIAKGLRQMRGWPPKAVADDLKAELQQIRAEAIAKNPTARR